MISTFSSRCRAISLGRGAAVLLGELGGGVVNP
jgi:hypothetical protein